MKRFISFGQKIGLGFGMMVLVVTLMGLITSFSLNSIIRDKDRIIQLNVRNLIEVSRLRAVFQEKVAAVRGFLINKDQDFITALKKSHEQSQVVLKEILGRVTEVEEEEAIEKIRTSIEAHSAIVDRVIGLRKSGASMESIAKVFDEQQLPLKDVADRALADFTKLEESLLAKSSAKVAKSAANTEKLVLGIIVFSVGLALLLAFALSRLLIGQIGSAVHHIQSSSNELQSVANQQNSGTKEQVSSMNEISTTTKELVSTAKQIAESAQQVAHIAEDTASAAKAGDLTVQKTQEAISGIKKQVDQIVIHMLDLGKKSQQIGGVLEIINELAEQTNILAINATIEAVGAGEAGKRFAVVADEIRKLADRVGLSTKEIRALIEDIRGAVHTTVMATESGSKAVDSGARQFSEVALAFRQIGNSVITTTEAAREIELSTKQQTSSIEQVNIAIANVTQAAKESEASSSQTFQTVSELTTLSKNLAKLIRPMEGE